MTAAGLGGPGAPRWAGRRGAGLAALLLALACDQAGRTGPRPTSISPDHGDPAAPVAVRIHGERLAARVATDFADGGGDVLDARFQAYLGTTPLLDVQLAQDGSLTATVPAGLADGAYDLVVVDPEGRAGTLARAYSVASGATPASVLGGIVVEVGPAQEVSRPFAVTVTVVDSAGAPVIDFDGAVALSDLTGTVVPARLEGFVGGRWSGQVEVRAAHAADMLTASAVGAMGSSGAFAVVPAAATLAAFETAPITTAAGRCAGPVTVALLDAYGEATVAGSAVRLAVGPTAAATVSLFADAGCTTALGTPTAAAGAGRLSLWFQAAAAGTLELAAAVEGGTATLQRESVMPGPAAVVVFLNAPQTATAGACSGAVTARVEDAFGNPAPDAFPVEVQVSPAGAVALFADAACTVPASTFALSNDAHVQLHFLGTVAQPVELTVSAGTAAAAQAETIAPGTPAQLVFTTPPRTAAAGACSGAVAVASQDTYGNASPVSAATAVALSASPASGFTFYSDAACTTAITGVTLDAGAANASFHFRGTVAGSVTATARASGMTPDATQVEEIDPAVASRLAFTSAPQTVAAGACSAAVTLRTEDAFGNARPVAAPAALLLSSATLALYADPACVVPLARLDLLAGDGGGTVYFEGSLAGAAELLADGTASGLGSAAQPEQIAAASASHLAYATAARTAAAGACSDVVTLQSQDRYGNASPVSAATAAALSAAPAIGFTLYSDAACTAAVTTVTLAAGASGAGFHFRGTAAGTVTVTATAAGLGAGVVQDETVTPLAPTHLAFTTPARAVDAGACSGVVTVEARDAYENASPPSAAAAVALSVTPSAGFAFYADEACTTAITGMTLGAGAASASFHFAGTAAGAVTLTAGAGGMAPDAAQAATIRPAAADHLAFTTATQTVVAGDCSAALTVQLEDQFGNLAPVSSATAVALTASPAAGFAFYAGARCSGASQSSVSIAAGAAATSFSFRPSTSGAYTVTAAMDGAVLPASQVETVLARYHFVWSPISSPRLSTLPVWVSVQCVDWKGDPNPNFASTATLTASTGAVSCLSDWRTPVTCGGFTKGVWSGWVVGLRAAHGVTLTAVSGDVRGTSAPFEIAGPAGRSPPLVRVWANPRVAYPYNYFHLYTIYDAASPWVASEDYQTPATGLSVSGQLATLADHQAAATPDASPWSGWKAWDADLAFFTDTPGVYYPRVAVRDDDPAGPDVGYGYQLLVVAASPADVCQVNTSSLADDGATSCAAPGPDGVLSLTEAVRLANAWTGTTTPTIYLPDALAITSVGTLTLTHAVNIVSDRYQRWTGERFGPILDGAAITISASGVLVSGLELAHQTAPLTVSAGADAALHDVYIHDGAGVLVQGTATIADSRLARCAGTCVQENDSAARLAIHGSDFEGAGGDVGVALDACDGTKPNVAGVTSRFGSWPASGSAFVGSTVFTGFDTAVRTSCTYSWVNSDTFYRNGIGVQGAAGYIVDGIFDGQMVSAVDSTDCSAFQALNRQIVWENASDGCLAATLAAESDTTAFSADPLFVFPEARDFRLQYGSPAKDRANAANMVDVDGPGPGLYLGAGPDRGARETW